jgi:mono/diheme cytochrome c family protein
MSASTPPASPGNARRRVLAAAAPLAAALLAFACSPRAGAPPALPAVSGEALFASYCSPCHQPEGPGATGAPPLAPAPWVGGPEGRLIRIVLHGVRGVMRVGEATYDREMPGFGRVLTDGQIAILLSHVRRHHGGGSPPISEAAVARIRAAARGREGYWTVEELLQVE